MITPRILTEEETLDELRLMIAREGTRAGRDVEVWRAAMHYIAGLDGVKRQLTFRDAIANAVVVSLSGDVSDYEHAWAPLSQIRQTVERLKTTEARLAEVEAELDHHKDLSSLNISARKDLEAALAQMRQERDALREHERAIDEERAVWFNKAHEECRIREQAETRLTQVLDVLSELERYRRLPIRAFNPIDDAEVRRQERIENVFMDAWLPKLRAALAADAPAPPHVWKYQSCYYHEHGNFHGQCKTCDAPAPTGGQ